MEAHVIVGPTEQVYTAHNGLLCEASHFFRAALKGNFKEALTGAVELQKSIQQHSKSYA